MSERKRKLDIYGSSSEARNKARYCEFIVRNHRWCLVGIKWNVMDARFIASIQVELNPMPW